MMAMAAILKNGRRGRHMSNLVGVPFLNKLFWVIVSVCQVSYFYRKMHDFLLSLWTISIANCYLHIILLAILYGHGY